MNLLSGLLIVLCLIGFVSAEGHRSKRHNFKVFKQRRNLREESAKDIYNIGAGLRAPTTTTVPSTTTASLY